MSFLFYEILTPMDICCSHSIATVSPFLLVEGDSGTILNSTNMESEINMSPSQ